MTNPAAGQVVIHDQTSAYLNPLPISTEEKKENTSLDPALKQEFKIKDLGNIKASVKDANMQEIKE